MLHSANANASRNALLTRGSTRVKNNVQLLLFVFHAHSSTHKQKTLAASQDTRLLHNVPQSYFCLQDKGLYLLLKDDKVCAGVCLSMCVCVCVYVCFGRIIRPCALLPKSSLTTGLSHNESTLSRTLARLSHTHRYTHRHGHTHTHTPYWARLQMFENKHAHIITHTLCKCLTETVGLKGGERERERLDYMRTKEREKQTTKKQIITCHFISNYTPMCMFARQTMNHPSLVCM